MICRPSITRVLACAIVALSCARFAAADEPNLGVNLDVFHYYTGPSKFEDLAQLTPANLAFVQVCDVLEVPRELATDADVGGRIVAVIRRHEDPTVVCGGHMVQAHAAPEQRREAGRVKKSFHSH